MNTPAANRHRLNLIHAEKGTTRNNAGGRGSVGQAIKRHRYVPPSGRRAEPRRIRGGVNAARGRKIA